MTYSDCSSPLTVARPAPALAHSLTRFPLSSGSSDPQNHDPDSMTDHGINVKMDIKISLYVETVEASVEYMSPAISRHLTNWREKLLSHMLVLPLPKAARIEGRRTDQPGSTRLYSYRTLTG